MSRNKGTTTPGFVNPLAQEVIRNTDKAGTDHGQFVHELKCQHCGHHYGANGSDIFERKCPNCQGGRPGLAL
jgi:peptide methionine sulfoxide reductase MsrB